MFVKLSASSRQVFPAFLLPSGTCRFIVFLPGRFGLDSCRTAHSVCLISQGFSARCHQPTIIMDDPHQPVFARLLLVLHLLQAGRIAAACTVVPITAPV